MEVLLAVIVGLGIFGLLFFIIDKTSIDIILGIVVVFVLIPAVILFAWFIGGLVLDFIFNTDIVHTKWET